MTRTMMSKRKLRALVIGSYVKGWMTHVCPRCRVCAAAAALPLRFVIWSAHRLEQGDPTVDTALLDICIRDNIGEKAARVMAVLHPLKVVLTNWDADKTLADGRKSPEAPRNGQPHGRVRQRAVH